MLPRKSEGYPTSVKRKTAEGFIEELREMVLGHDNGVADLDPAAAIRVLGMIAHVMAERVADLEYHVMEKGGE